MIKVTHIIDALDVGGAEKLLASLLAGTDRSSFCSDVISLKDIGPVGNDIIGMGVPVRALDMQLRPSGVGRANRLVPWLRRSNPDLVQTWLYESDLLGGLASRLAHPHTPVVWGLHQGDLDPARCKRRRIWAARSCARLSKRVPTQVVSCSHVAAQIHERLGYDPARMVVIPNGVDLRHFAPDPFARHSIRRELGLNSDAYLVGLMARFDPQKDHKGFIAAAAALRQIHPGVHFVLCGGEITPENRVLAAWITQAGLGEHVHLLGLRHDVARLAAALDVMACSSAYGEAAPLVLLEAMACGVPCVTTDVGDSGFIVGSTGFVVPPNDQPALTLALARILRLKPEKRQALGQAARKRVEASFSLPTTVDRYQELYEHLHRRRRLLR